MRKTRVFMMVVISLLLLVALALVGIMALGMTGRLPDMGFGFLQTELANQQSWDAGEIDSLKVNYGSERVTLIPATDGKVTLKEYMSRWEDDMLAGTSQSGGSLSIQAGRRPLSIGWLGWNCHIELYVPADWLCDVVVDNASGGVRAEHDFSFRSLAVQSGSGSVKLAGITAEGDISLETGSGSVSADMLDAGGNVNLHAGSGSVKPGRVRADGDITAKAGSGSVSFEQAAGRLVTASTNSGGLSFERLDGQFDLNCGSGSLKVESGTGGGTATTGSGSVKVTLEALLGDVSLKAGSGGCRMTLPAGTALNLRANTGSGGVNVPDGGNLSYDKSGNVTSGGYGVDPQYTVTLTTGSGSARLEFD